MLRCFSVSSYRSLQEEDCVSDIVALQDDAVPQERHRVSLDDTVPAPRTFRKPASPLGPPARHPPPPVAGKGSPRPLSSPPSAAPAALGDRLSPLLLPASSSSPSPGRRRPSPGGLDGSRAPPGFVKHLEANLRRKDPAGGTSDTQQGAAERYIRLPTQGTQSNSSNNNNNVVNNNSGPTSPPEVPAPPVPQSAAPVPLPRAKTPDNSGTGTTSTTAPIPATRNLLPVGRSPVVGRKMATAATRQQQSLVSRPPGGWLHPDREIMGQGVTYGVRYIGCLEVKTSMKCLDFDTRSLIAKECISRVCEAAGLKTVDKKRKVDRRLQRMLADRPGMDYAGSNVNLRVTSSSLNLTVMESGEVIACHEMPNISFASGGDAETLDFVAYVAKDSHYSRACFVLECGGGLAQDVITTIGQAFKLRFREFMRWAPSSQPPLPGLPDRQDSVVPAVCNGMPGCRAVPREDPEYYNDLPGKIPPEAPPPVPPLPDYRVDDGATEASQCTTAKEATSVRRQPIPRHTVPPQPTARKLSRDTNLIDLSCDVPLPTPSKLVHDYVNTDPILKASENGAVAEPARSASLDPFDMQPFANSVPPPPPRHHPKATAAPPMAPPRPGSVALPVAEHAAESTTAGNPSDRHRATLEKEEWFHGTISRQESETRVTGDGDFLVRESRGSPGQYVLTGMQGTVRRHLLLVDPQGVVRTKDRTFESVSHLINYHRDNGLPIISAESALVLKTAVPRLPH